MGYRFRTEGDLLVLQVMDRDDHSVYGYRNATWRDATVKDIPINDPFSRVEHVYVGSSSPPTPVFD